MKLLNYTTSYLSISFLIVISIWATIFYYAMLDEIYDSIDDGLDNQKGLVIQKAARDSTLLNKKGFEESDYSIIRIPAKKATTFNDVYIDTSMYMQNEKSFEPVRMLKTVFIQDGRYYQLQIVTSMVEEDDLIEELLYALLWLYLGMIITILVLNNFLLKRIWRPFYRLLTTLKNFRLEDPLPIKYESTKVDEFKLLNETIQKLLQSNVDTYTSQMHFIENASHELQTPLAISINKLERLAEYNNFSKEELALLASALNNLERLTRLNRALLLLSKIENRQFSIELEINMNTLIRKIVEDFSDQLSYSSLAINVDEQESCIIKMNEDLAVVMVTNLIKNAIVHNHPNGFINITITKKSLVIVNSGIEKALNVKQLFNRFYKQQPSDTSTGLGLAIVKAITDLYQFKLSYSYNNRHIIHVIFS